MFINPEIENPSPFGGRMKPRSTIKIRSAPANGAGRRGAGGNYRHLTRTE